MQTGRLILLLLLVLVVAVVVVLLVRSSRLEASSSASRRPALRTEAEQIAATARRARRPSPSRRRSAPRWPASRPRSGPARPPASRPRPPSSARPPRPPAASTRQTMSRADDVDPDVKESSFAPSTSARPTATPTGRPKGNDEARTRTRTPDDDALPIRGPATAPLEAGAAHRRRAGGRRPVPRCGCRAVTGPRTDRHPESQRIASAADYRDDACRQAARPDDDVYGGPAVGRAGGMSDDARPDTMTTSAPDGRGSGHLRGLRRLPRRRVTPWGVGRSAAGRERPGCTDAAVRR